MTDVLWHTLWHFLCDTFSRTCSFWQELSIMISLTWALWYNLSDTSSQTQSLRHNLTDMISQTQSLWHAPSDMLTLIGQPRSDLRHALSDTLTHPNILKIWPETISLTIHGYLPEFFAIHLQSKSQRIYIHHCNPGVRHVHSRDGF